MSEVARDLSQHRLKLLETHNLTEKIRNELRQSGRSISTLDFDSSIDYVLVKLVSMIDDGNRA
jgi:hypothetical protein